MSHLHTSVYLKFITPRAPSVLSFRRGRPGGLKPFTMSALALRPFSFKGSCDTPSRAVKAVLWGKKKSVILQSEVIESEYKKNMHGNYTRDNTSLFYGSVYCTFVFRATCQTCIIRDWLLRDRILRLFISMSAPNDRCSAKRASM